MSNTRLPYDRTSYILVVDDDKTLLKFFKIHLNKFFSKVIVVKNAKEAVAVLKEKEIDLVISDIKMPKTDGLQLMKKVRTHDPSIPVFLISGAFLTDDKMEQIFDKADAFLKKPFDVDQLHGFISKGLKLRRIYAKLYNLVPNKRKFKEVIKGNLGMNELKEEAKKKEAVKLLKEIARDKSA